MGPSGAPAIELPHRDYKGDERSIPTMEEKLGGWMAKNCWKRHETV